MFLRHQIVERHQTPSSIVQVRCQSDAFFTELSEYLEVVALNKCQIVIAGDLNIHVERGEDGLHAARLHEIFATFDCSQHVPNTLTHRHGGILGLVITKFEQAIGYMRVLPPNSISDHSVII